jgi:hypothetical protein
MSKSLVLESRPASPAEDIAGDAQALSTAVRRLLTVVPPAAQTAPEHRPMAVLWVYRDYDNRWCVRQEGGKFEAAFPGRDKAVACARAAGHAAGSYRLFLMLKDGRVIEEHFNPANRQADPPKMRLPFIH